MTQPAPSSSLLTWLRLFRLPNVFTAIADVVMGWLLAGGFSQWPENGVVIGRFVCALLASATMYTAGMVLNDLFDLEVDQQERPSRPLPSGKISLTAAKISGWGLLLAGLLFAGVSAALNAETMPVLFRLRVVIVAVLLAGCIVLYNTWAKKSIMGSFVMGACRFLNVLLGVSAAAVFWLENDAPANSLSLLYFAPSELVVAAAIGVYIVGVTVFARNEAEDQSGMGLLATGMMIMIAGYALLAVFPLAGGGMERLAPAWTYQWWLVLVGLLSVTMLRRCYTTMMNPVPAQVQGAIKQFIFSLIMLDAAVCLGVGHIAWSIVVVLFLAPMFLLGRWVYST